MVKIPRNTIDCWLLINTFSCAGVFLITGCQAFLFFLFSSLNSFFSYFLLFFSLNSYFSYFFQILRLSLGWVCKSALCQGHGLSALNLPSCRSRVQGPNELGGVLLGGGDSLQHSGFIPQCRVFKGSVNLRHFLTTFNCSN